MTDAGLAPNNPYANCGLLVTGAEFVGRADHLRAIRDRMFASLEAAPVSIVGPPRVGKSSLAMQVLDEFAVGQSPSGRIFVPVCITVSGVESEKALFRDLADSIMDWFIERGLPTDRMQASYAIVTTTDDWDEMCRT